MKVFVSAAALALASAQDSNLGDGLAERGFSYYGDGAFADTNYGGNYDYSALLSEYGTNEYVAYSNDNYVDSFNYDSAIDGEFGNYESNYETVDFNQVEAPTDVEDAPVVIDAPAPVVSEKEKVRPGNQQSAGAGKGMDAGGELGAGDGFGPFHYCQRLHGVSFSEAVTKSASAITNPNDWMDCDVQHAGTQLDNQACLYTIREVGSKLLVWSTCSTIATCRTQMAQNYNDNHKSMSQCRDNSQTTNPRFRKPSTCNFCGKLSQDADRHVPFINADDTNIEIAGAPVSFYDLAKNEGNSFGSTSDVYWTTSEEETGSETKLGAVYAGQAYRK